MLAALAEESFVIEYVKSIRKQDPGIGGRKLWLMYCKEFGEENAMGHCRFEDHNIKVQVGSAFFQPKTSYNGLSSWVTHIPQQDKRTDTIITQ